MFSCNAELYVYVYVCIYERYTQVNNSKIRVDT